ncbi:MAG TPA: MFS transporter [Terriglobales bacterium]|nr:MFS transporter [Terriglobales bacterium]
MAQSAMQRERKARVQPVTWLRAGFALTGAGTTLFGCILPALNLNWHLDDRHAGILFAAQFTGAALGALLVRNDFFRSLVSGYLALIVSAALITFFPRNAEVLLFLAFGVSLGLTMTATSMLVGSTYPNNRGAALSVLNAFWGLGAALSPAIASLWVRLWPPAYLFLVLAAALMVTFLLITTNRTALTRKQGGAGQGSSGRRSLKLVSIFAVIAFLYVGTEVSVSGWMMSYVSRLPISSKAWAPIAASCFWVALVCGRMLVPGIARWLSEAQLLTSSLTIAFIGVMLLLASRLPLAVVFSAALSGLMIGPIFPLCVANVLSLTRDSAESKWIFAISGLGGAVLPWMTGEFSAHSSSLRFGLLVPVFALGAMMLLNLLAGLSRVSEEEKI